MSVCSKIGGAFHSNTSSVRARMPDYFLAKGASFCERSQLGTVVGASRYEKVLKTYLNIAERLHDEGKHPLVHGQSAWFMIPQTVVHYLGFAPMRQIRFPGDDWKDSEEVRRQLAERVQEAEEAFQRFPIFSAIRNVIKPYFNRSMNDHQLEVRAQLLSGTVGGFHFQISESPFSFVFGGIVGSDSGMPIKLCEKKPNRSVLAPEMAVEVGSQMISCAMRTRGYSEAKIEKVVKDLSSFYPEADALPIGQIIVIGMPDALMERYVYHSTPLGFPTGEDPRIPSGQVRLIMDPEVIDSEEVSVDNVMRSLISMDDPTSIPTSAQVEEIMSDFGWKPRAEDQENEIKAIAAFKDLENRIKRVISEYL